MATILIYLQLKVHNLMNKSACDDKSGNYHSIVFLKTHKTGGSTMVTILQRYAEQHKLKVALPNKTHGELRYNYFGDVGETLTRDHIYDPIGNTTFDVLCNHVIYNAMAFRSIFKRRTFYFTILRDPVNNVLSAMNYFGLADGYIQRLLLQSNTTSPLRNLPRYEPDNVYLSFTNNRQLFDLGFSPEKNPRNKSIVSQFIEEIENGLHFVMIMEHFDESLILIKRLLNWTFKDILYVPQNRRRKMLVPNVTKDDEEAINRWNSGDRMLYSHFYSKLLKQIRTGGHDLRNEVSSFRKILRSVWDFCDQDEQSEHLSIPRTPWEAGFVYTYEECSLLRLNELQYLERLYYNAI